jgi:signal transduction histidine kinase
MLDALRTWFLANRPIIIFIYGQVFFVMGVAILLQSRRYSRLDLARSLPWLAAFGILHGFNEWGDLFIPIQAQFVPDPVIHFMRAIQTLLLAISFACLLQFGVELFRPLPDRFRWLRFVPLAVLVLWLLGGFWIGLQLSPDLETWHDVSNATARYMLGFPGALLAAFSLRRHARLRIQPLGLPRIYNTLRVAGLALAAYAVLGGIIASRAPIFPANVLNSEWVVTHLAFPPSLLRSIAGLVLAVTIIRALEVFEVETDRLIDQMEQAQVIAIERERIGRDLHDGAIQTVYSAGLLAEALRKKADGPVAAGLDRLMSTLNEAIADLRGFMSDLRSDNSSADLATAITSVIEATRKASGLKVDWTPQPLAGLPPDRITHLIAFVREALSNAVRHAQARSIQVRAEVIDRHLKLSVRDDGRGFAADTPHGFGLRNMRDRARLLGGEVIFDSTPGKGTTVTLNIPMEREA